MKVFKWLLLCLLFSMQAKSALACANLSFTITLPECAGEPLILTHTGINCSNLIYTISDWPLNGNGPFYSATTGGSGTVSVPASTFVPGQSYYVFLEVQGGGANAGGQTFTFPELPTMSADFTMNGSSANPLTVCLSNQPINFADATVITNTNTGYLIIGGYDWQFGDGNSSTATNPSHSYSSPGTYTVSLTVYPYTNTGNPCPPQVVTKTVIVQELEADFSFNTPVCAGDNVQFTNNSTCYTTSVWNFGDGSSPSNQTNPSHIYSAPGVYTVQLTVFANGSSDTYSQQITVTPTPGSIINGILSMCANDVVRTYSAGTSGAGYTYQWTAIGSIPSPTTGTGSSFNVTWGSNGGSLELITTNSAGCSSTVTEQITILPVPTPQITGPIHSCTDFSATYSVAIGSFTSTYAWTATGGTINGASNNPSVNVNWTAPGGTLTLTETNGQGCVGSTTIQVNIGPIPSPNISGPTDLCNGLTTNHSVNPASIGSSYQWSAVGGTINGSSTSVNVSTTWGPAGGVLTLTETNSLGCVGSTSITIANCCNINVVINTLDACFNTCDGWAEVVNPPAGFTYDWGNGAGPVVASSIINLCAGNYAVSVYDANNILCIVQAFTVNTSGTPQSTVAFNPRTDYPMDLGRRIYLFDINYDGFDDLVSANNQIGGGNPDGINIRFNDGAANFNAFPVNTYFSGQNIESLAYNDVNNDGFNDLIAQSWTQFHVLINDGNGNFSPILNYTDPAGFKGELECEDLNGDFLNDILTVNGQTRELYIYYHTGSAVHPFYNATPDITLDAPAAISYWEAKIVDLDNDGNDDIVCEASGGLNTIYTFISAGGATPFTNNMTPTNQYSTGTGVWPRGIDVVEMNNPGSQGLDFVVSLQQTNEVIVSFDVATSPTPLIWQRYSTGDQPVGQVIGDVDNDGDMDVIVAVHFPTSYVRVFINDGFGVLSSFVDLPTPAQTTEVDAGNLNDQECCLDIVTANRFSQTSSVFLNVCEEETELVEGTVFCGDGCSLSDPTVAGALVQLTDQNTNTTYYLQTDQSGGYDFMVPITGNTYLVELVNGNYAPCSGPIGPVPGNSFANDFWIEDTCLVDVTISGGYAGGATVDCPVPTTPCEDIIWDYCVTFTNQGCSPTFVSDFELTLPAGNHQILSVSDLTECGTTNVIPSNIIQGSTVTWIPAGNMPAGACYTACVQVQFGSGLTATPTATGIVNYICEPAGPAQNTDALVYNSSCSCDPNFKTVYPLGCGTKQAIGNEELTYTVHFGNIGSGPAANIRIEDQLDTDLDWASFVLVGASHTISSTLIDGNGLMIVEFNGINLAPQANGWFKYKMSPLANVSNLTTVSNEASIYFDNNPAVVTNTVSNLIVLDPLTAEVDPACAVVYLGYGPAECVTLTAIPSGGVSPYSYKWSTGETTVSINACPTSQTTYSVTITDDIGCTTVAESIVHVEKISCGRGKVIVCHQSGRSSIDECVPVSDVPLHLAHGDQLGSCELIDPCNPPPASREIPANNRPAANAEIAIYPNPTTGYFTLDLKTDQSREINIALTNLLGQNVRQWQEDVDKGRFTTQLDISNLPAGTYFITIDNGIEKNTRKLIKN